MVQTGDLLPGRAIDLGCGEGDNAIFLAEHGFQVTAVDFAPSAIKGAKASDAGVDVDFVIDDITTLATVSGTFDIVVDYGTFDDLSTKAARGLCRSSQVVGKTWCEVLAVVL